MPTLDGPRQVILVTSRETIEILGKPQVKDDIAEVTWHTPVSLEPMRYAIALPRESFSLKVIQKANHFVVNFMPYEKKDHVHTSMQHHSEHVNKFEKANLTQIESEKIDAPRVKEAVAHLECEVEQFFQFDDHVLVIGHVLYNNLEDNAPRLFQISPGKYTTTREA